jgi:perosamine synthetase
MVTARRRSRSDDPLPFARPDIDDDDVQGVVDTLRSGWITTGPRVQEFENRFASRIGVKHAVALNSATAALHLALDAIGLKSGDEVVVPTTTFTASAEVVRYFDAKPVLVDVLPDTMCIDPTRLEAAVGNRTRAVIPVHFGGHPAEMDDIMEIASAHDLVVIEDAAHVFPGTYRGRSVGSIGHMAAFSFYATKTIATGEGGMLVCNDDQFEARARLMSLHGMSRDSWRRYTVGGSWRYDVIAPGFKYNMTDIAASLGLTQMAKCDTMAARRAEIAGRYSSALAQFSELEAPTSHDDVQHSWHIYLLRLNLDQMTIDRDRFVDELTSRGIGVSVHFIPVHSFTYYREKYGYTDSAFPVAAGEFRRSLSLPIYSAMSDSDVDDVISVVGDLVETFRR